MNIIIFGKRGKLGWELHRSFQNLGQVSAFDYPEIDYTVLSSLKRVLEDIRPQLVINAAAYTEVDKAEVEVTRANLINSDAPAYLAEICSGIGAALVHYSTDYVFNGQKGAPYNEDDTPQPLNAYGRSKLEGERLILQAGGGNLIFRTSWIYGNRGDCFVSKVLDWSHCKHEIRVVQDQISNPTWARLLADITALLFAKASRDLLPWVTERAGIYHLAGWGFASRLEWVKAIIENDPEPDKRIVNKIIPARNDEFPTAAVRPLFSALDCRRFEDTFGLRLPDWRIALKLALESNLSR